MFWKRTVAERLIKDLASLKNKIGIMASKANTDHQKAIDSLMALRTLCQTGNAELKNSINGIMEKLNPILESTRRNSIIFPKLEQFCSTESPLLEKLNAVGRQLSELQSVVQNGNDRLGVLHSDNSRFEETFSLSVNLLRDQDKVIVEKIAENGEKLQFIGNRTHFFDELADQLKHLSEQAEKLIAMARSNEEKIKFVGDRTRLFDELTTQINSLNHQVSEEMQKSRLGVFRNEIAIRWQILDAFSDMFFPPEMQIECPICHHTAAKNVYETKLSYCRFGGGRLERYLCPECGVIFGPLKMMNLSPEQLAAEYRQAYAVYSESDCTAQEESIFFDLDSKPDGIYLNYGAGAWNSTLLHLREKGYTVYNFEPFAPAASGDFLITDFDLLSRMKFDGIFSNDLLEHLPDPVGTLKFMKTLLKPGGVMIHGSGCFDYEFPYTRFHLFFYTGSSLKRIAEMAGLQYSLSDRVFDYSPFRKCRFTPLPNDTAQFTE